jgi:hypothetical protein
MTMQSSRLQRLGGVLAPSVLPLAHFNIDDLPRAPTKPLSSGMARMGRLAHSCPANLLCYCSMHRPNEFMAGKNVA